ncbi:MAG: adenosine kinase [Fibromonadaceae bacterium]|jgi:sugar/nucleoside kinase (ribokinase family)|nr:adenosine kinase [Fibromonadaceae bacterium]
MKQAIGIGAALVDLVTSVSEGWIVRCKKQKGGMYLVNWGEIGRILGNVDDLVTLPGGSASNTMVGLAKLGGQARFICKVGNDELGDLYSLNLYRSGVNGFVRKSATPTGRVLSAVTPDAQRTMFTYTGASAELLATEISYEPFENTNVLYIEGYLAYNPSILLHCINVAKDLGLQVIFDCGSYTVINDCRFILDSLINERKIDIIIANSDEAKALTGREEHLACTEMAKMAKTAIVKIGKKGSLVCDGGEVLHINAIEVKAIDTTGAGDLWASGFLYGYLNEWPIEKCAKLASAVAAEVVQVMGSIIPDESYSKLLKIRDEIAQNA